MRVVEVCKGSVRCGCCLMWRWEHVLGAHQVSLCMAGSKSVCACGCVCAGGRGGFRRGFHFFSGGADLHQRSIRVLHSRTHALHNGVARNGAVRNAAFGVEPDHVLRSPWARAWSRHGVKPEALLSTPIIRHSSLPRASLWHNEHTHAHAHAHAPARARAR